jgi:hypothetical protein
VPCAADPVLTLICSLDRLALLLSFFEGGRLHFWSLPDGVLQIVASGEREDKAA